MSASDDDLTPIERALERAKALPLDAIEETPSDPPHVSPRLYHFDSRKSPNGLVVSEQPTLNMAQAEEDWLECDNPAEVRL